MKKIVSVICACAFACISVYARQTKDEVLKVLPADSMIAQALSIAPLGDKNFMVVKKNVIPYPASWETLTPAEKQLKLFNIMSRISTQVGISYPVQNAALVKKNTITNSSYISAPGSQEMQTETAKKDDSDKDEEAREKSGEKHHEKEDDDEGHAILDPVAAELPQRLERRAEQEDSLFGEMEYSHIFTSTDTETLLTETNLSTMKFAGTTCADKREYTVYTSALQTEAGIELDSVTVLNNHDSMKKILFWNVDLADAFGRKSDALSAWYRNLIALEK
jgi:hypothetical protein